MLELNESIDNCLLQDNIPNQECIEKAQYCFYYFDFLTNDDDELLKNNLIVFANTDECDDQSAELTNYFNNFDNDYDLEIGQSFEYESQTSESSPQPFGKSSTNSQSDIESRLGESNGFNVEELMLTRSTHQHFKSSNHTFKLLNNAAMVLEHDSLLSNLNHQIEKNSNCCWDEAIDFSEIAVDLDDFDVVFIETSTPTYLPESEYETTDDRDLKLNDFVCVNGKKYGYLRYIGNSHFMSVITCGIELKEADGKYDGEKDQIRYFQCEQNHGIFAPIEQVKLVLSVDHTTDTSTNRTAYPIADITTQLDKTTSFYNGPVATEIKHSQANSNSSSSQKILNKTFDLDESEDSLTEMIESRLKPVETKLIRGGLVNPSQIVPKQQTNTTSNSLGSRSTSSTCSTSSASSSSSSSSIQPEPKRNNLDFKMNLNRYNSSNASNTNTPNNKQQVIRQSSAQNCVDTNLTRVQSSDASNNNESALKYKSKLNPPSKLIKYTPASATSSEIPARNIVTFQQQQQIEQHLASSSLKKQISLQHQQQLPKSTQTNSDSKQIKIIKTGQTTTESNLKQPNSKYSSNNQATVEKNSLIFKTSGFNELANHKLHSLPVNLTSTSGSSISSASIRTSSPKRSPLRQPQPTTDNIENINNSSKVSRLSKINTPKNNNSPIPVFGVAKQPPTGSVQKNEKPTSAMIATSNNNNIQRRSIGSLQQPSSCRTTAKLRANEATKSSYSTPNNKGDLLTNANKSTSRSSSTASTVSRSSSKSYENKATQPKLNMNIFQPKINQLNNRSQQNNSTAQAVAATKTNVNAMNMYQPSISFLSKPITGYSNEQTSAKKQASLNTTYNYKDQSKNQMNETFDIEDDDLNELSDKQEKLKLNKHQEKIEENKRRSIQLIESNFSKMNTEHCHKANLLGGFLDFEEMPDFEEIPDYNMTETNTSLTTVKNNNNSTDVNKLNENESNSLLDVDSFAQLLDNSHSSNNIPWPNLKPDAELKTNVIEVKQDIADAITFSDKATKEIEEHKEDIEVLVDCRIALDDIITQIVSESLCVDVFISECQLVINNLIDHIETNNSTSDAILTEKHMANRETAEADLKSLPTVEHENTTKMKTNGSQITKSVETKKSPVSPEKTRMMLPKQVATTVTRTIKSAQTVTTVNSTPLAVSKIKRVFANTETVSKSMPSKTLTQQQQQSTDALAVNKLTPRKPITSKIAATIKTSKVSEPTAITKQDCDDSETKSVSSRTSKSSGLVRQSTVKATPPIYTSNLALCTSINKSSSSINSVNHQSQSEKSDLCTPSLKKPTSSKTARANRLTTLSAAKQKSSGNNKENQQTSSAFSQHTSGLAKIYKSRDGLAAVSSNTSIMSEVSNISLNSKTSIPTSNHVRQNSFSSNTSTTTSRASLLIKQTSQPVATTAVNRFQPATPAKNPSLLKQINGQSSALAERKTSLQIDCRSAPTKKVLAGNSVVSTHRQNFEQLTVNTKASVKSGSPSPSIRTKNELNSKNNEINRLEALCETRTKELSMAKIKLRETLISFDAIAVAYNFLANELNGFEVVQLRSIIKKNKKTLEDSIRQLKQEIDVKDYNLKLAEQKLEKLLLESCEAKARLEAKIEEMNEKHESECIAIQKQADLIIADIKKEKEQSIMRLNKTMETTRFENEVLITDLGNQLKNKQSEAVELESRLKECEETLAKDNDERIQRLIDTQHNLEKEIESLKTALDIKNVDLFDLRTKNNELITKLDNFDEIKIKYRRYKQEMENLQSILQSKTEHEKRAAEHNRMLANKVEVKSKENQRLSMQNEQLQFRLQSQPNLSLNQNGNESFNLSDISINDNSFFTKVHESENDYIDQCNPLTVSAHGATFKRVSTSSKSNYDPQMDSYNKSVGLTELLLNDETPVVKLRSKSFKSQLSQKLAYEVSTVEHKKYSHSFHNTNGRQFRPVSDAFNFDLNEHDFNAEHAYEMTRSDIIYDENDTHNTTYSLTDACESNEKYSNSNSSSTSLLDSQSTEDNQMTKSVPCMVLKAGSEDKMMTCSDSQGSHFTDEGRNECEKFNSLSSSSLSVNEHSVILLE